MCTTAKYAIEETSLANGNITHHSMTSILDNHQRNMEDIISSQNRLIDEHISAFLSSEDLAQIETNNSPYPPTLIRSQ